MKTVTRLEVLLLEGLAPSGEDRPLSSQFWSELKADAAQIASRKLQPKKKKTER